MVLVPSTGRGTLGKIGVGFLDMCTHWHVCSAQNSLLQAQKGVGLVQSPHVIQDSM